MDCCFLGNLSAGNHGGFTVSPPSGSSSMRVMRLTAVRSTQAHDDPRVPMGTLGVETAQTSGRGVDCSGILDQIGGINMMSFSSFSEEIAHFPPPFFWVQLED
jgi:hypothetical protein